MAIVTVKPGLKTGNSDSDMICESSTGIEEFVLAGENLFVTWTRAELIPDDGFNFLLAS